MRGEILQYDDGVGSGLISGDDGVRYSFQRADLQQLRPLTRGMRVDFVPSATVATQIFVLENQPAQSSAFGAPESSNEDLSLWGYFAKCMAKSFNGEGRARRKEYWSFVLFEILFLVIGFIAFAVIAGATGGGYDPEYVDYSANPEAAIAVLVLCLMVLVFIPAGITVTIRRLHDIGMSGWFYLIAFVPYIGGLILFVMSLIPSERRVNQHGPYPKPLD